MKTSRKEDWFVVIGVILLATLVAVFFLVRNRGGEQEEARPKQSLEHISPNPTLVASSLGVVKDYE